MPSRQGEEREKGAREGERQSEKDRERERDREREKEGKREMRAAVVVYTSGPVATANS